ncbi:MAG TPA: tRNA pseudouridine(38-40) synthase TruA [Bryobacteraceae bacterium]|nr:tRNA pseudouridine(38-40) synthase TruA [Bryobacteraceae bacterium]
MTRTWKLTLEYDGTRYSGWQEQLNARTVAGEVRRAAEGFLKTEVDLHGSGRTDAGVHALAQVAHLRARLRSAPGPEELRRALNSDLPADIAVLRADPASNDFHARHDAVRRSYIYQISTRKRAFEKRYVWWVKDRLDVEAMQAAAALLSGRHDFVCFRAPDPSKPHESTIVVVDSASVEIEGDMIVVRIAASHFLWRMVRRIVGVLVKLGLGEIAPADFDALLNARCSPKLDVAAWTAPAAGLFLEQVIYR